MKAWKALGLAALAIGLVPYHVEKDEEEKTSLYESLLLRVNVKRRTDEEIAGTDLSKTDINVSFVPLLNPPQPDEAEEFEDLGDLGED